MTLRPASAALLALASSPVAAQTVRLPTGLGPRIDAATGIVEEQHGTVQRAPLSSGALIGTPTASSPSATVRPARSATASDAATNGAVPQTGGTMTGPLALPKFIVGIAGTPSADWRTVGPFENIYNQGPGIGYGHRINYYSYGTDGGFDIGEGVLMIDRATAPHGTQSLASWLVNVCFDTQAVGFGCFVQEQNPVNRGADGGWGETRGQFNQWTGGTQVVPESSTFGEPGSAGNTLFGFLTASSGSRNAATGKFSKTYNGFIAEQNSIAPGGRGFLAGGDTLGLPSGYPYAPFEARRTWLHGLVTSSAAIQDGYALLMNQAQGIGWTDGTNFSGVGLTGAGATAAPSLTANGGRQLAVGTRAGADCPVVATGGKRGAADAILSVGCDVDLEIGSNGSIVMKPDGGFGMAISTGAVRSFSRWNAPLHTPSSSSETCTTGDSFDDANYHYVCVATDTLKRVALSGF